ncbi:MAG: biotin transporter BioY [Bdellovibrionales bacterium]|nr:biotin transporter BioY [Bdellovibrionales bacterium]
MIPKQTYLSTKFKDLSFPIAATFVTMGVCFLSLLAQVKLYLPISPVPITGQTFGVALIALIYGRKLGIATISTYLVAGAFGAPIFAKFQSGLELGPTMGYLIGMWVSTFIIGTLSDNGYTKTWPKAFLSCVLGSLAVFACGLSVLAFFVPADSLLMMGLVPFIAGDLFKNTLASFLATRIYKL